MTPPARLHTDDRRRVVAAAPQDLWRVVEGIGGEHGWYAPPGAWRLRGLLDRLAGGPGMRPGRPDPDVLAVGDPVDFWRVERLERGRLLRLRAETALPGEAWLELAVEEDEGRTALRQRVLFSPAGLAGSAYWWSLVPLHAAVFGTMVRTIAGAAERARAEREASPS